MKGILLVAYGSKEPDAEETMRVQARKLEEIRGQKVYTGFFRVSKPSIQEAMSQIAADGVDSLAVVPLLISDSSMTSDLIPEAIGMKGRKGTVVVDSKEIKVAMCGAVGTDAGVADLLVKEIEKAGGKKDTPILLIGHGSKDDKNPEAVYEASKGVKARGYVNLTVCFNEFCHPTVEEAFDVALRYADDKVLALPMFISDGVHIKKDIPPKIGLKEFENEGDVEYKGKKIHIFRESGIGSDPYFAEVISKRVDQLFSEL